MSSLDKLSSADKTHKPILSRGQVEAIGENPGNAEQVARLMAAVNLDNLFRHMQNPDINPQARIEFQKLLNRMGRLEQEAKQNTAGPQVVINITRAKDREHMTIDGQSTLLVE